MSYGQTELYTLLNVSAVTSLLTKSSYIFMGRAIPDKDADGVKIPGDAEVINVYRSSNIDNGIEYLQTSWSVNCRAPNEQKAENIAIAVVSACNRKGYGNKFFVASTLTVLPPADTTDVYNVPVEVIAKGRSI